MNNETQKIFEEQLVKLPTVVVDFISSTNWDADLDEIGSMHNLHEEELGNFKQEATFVLAGLVHPDEFRSTLEKEVGLHGSVLDAVTDATEQRIFASIRPALVEFFEQEANETKNEEIGVDSETVEIQNVPTAQGIPRAPQRVWEREPDIVPDNLPTDEEPDESADSRLGRELFLPPIPPKTLEAAAEVPSWDITPAHPFEGKMKKVFTAGQQSMGDLAIEPATPQISPPDTSRLAHDPYREAIE